MDRISQNSHDFAYRRRLRRKAPDPKRLDILKASIKTVSKEYCEESSICGLKHLVDDNTPFIERIIWIVTLVVGLICSVSLVWMTFDKYYSAPLVTTQLPEGIPVNKIIFPAVGICTNNRISKRAATELAKKLLKAERNQNYTEEEMMSLLFGLGQLYGLSAVNFNNVSPIELHNALGEYDVHELMQSDCNNYRGINLMSHTMKVWEKVIEKRQREESEIIQNQFGFMQGRGTMDAIFELHQLCERYRRAHKNLHKVFIHPEKLTPRCEDLLVRCVWNSEPRNCLDLFDFRLTMNGYCCTFNYLRPHDTIFQNVTNTSRNIDMYRYGNKSYFDYDQGLKVLLRLNESDDFFYNIPLQGAQLQFSDAYDFPDSPSGSFAMQIISPSVQMSVMVTASFTEASRDIQHVPIKLRKCRFYDESSYLPFYTYSDCMLKCRMHFLLDNCNCTPFNMLKMINARTCNMKDVPCLRTYYSQSISVRPIVDHVPAELELDAVNGGIDCPMCNPTCSKTAYSYDFNNVVLYPEYLNTVPDSERDEWQQGVNFTGISFVHVKYARDVADCYGQNVIMKWFDLISNIGSTCGFITGFSFVSVLEFIYFFTVKLVRELFRAYHTYHKFDMTAKESWRRYLEIWWNGIKSLPQTTSIHGFRFIADTQRHWLERIFWLIVVALSWYGSSLLIAAQYDAFQNNPISFVVETTYKDWNTEFPAVVVCENDNSNRVEAISDGLWGVDHDFNMEEVLKELAFFKGITYYTSEFCNLDDPLPDCMQTNLTYYANLVRSTCQETLANCSWNGIPFECCKYFRPMDTELGTCFAINTLQGREKNAPRLDMVSNSTTGPGAIKFDVMVTANIYILNEEEVPTLTTIGSDVLTVGPEIFHKRYITIRNIENDAGARLISPEKRKCRYTDENFLQVYHHYSYTACTVQCRKDAQLELCNCTNYFMPNVPEHLRCNVSGIICLNSHVHELSVLKASWSSRAGLACNCLPSCTEAEITITKDFKLITSDSYASVQIELAVLPSERYRRNVVRGVLDLVVSTGGTGGLFLGASILSFVELFYILLIRPFCDIYSQRDDDPWHRRFGLRRLQDNNFIPNWGWTYERKVDDKDNAKIEYRNQR